MNISRFYKTERLEYALEFLTPAFLGGADGNAELRAPPFKAALRWWWRVLYGGSYKTPEELAAREREIFGSTEKGSSIRISINGEIRSEEGGFPKGEKIEVTSSKSPRPFKINILDYLAFGLCVYEKDRGNVYKRSHLVPGQKFKYSVIVPAAVKNEINSCLNAFFAFGSIGSRSRNGFGSLSSVDGLNQAPYPLPWSTNPPFEYPTLNSRSKLFITKEYDTWEDALSEIGIVYKDARNALERKHSYERRGLVSRPIEVKGERIPDNIRKERSPKQFILHTGKQNGKYYGQILSLPIEFFEQDQKNNYNKVVDDMHKSFSQRMTEKTGDILKYMGARP